jgi:hypothetical protein
MEEINDPGFWQDVKPGSVVVLSDEQALLEAVRQGLDGEGGLNYDVERVLRLKELNGLADWVLLQLKGADEVWLMVKSVGSDVDLRVYFEVPEFRAGNRADMIAQEMYWLFEDPGPDWRQDYTALAFADTITMDQGHEDGNAVTICYRRKLFGQLFAGCHEQPVPPDDEMYPAVVVEYQTSDATDNQEMVILELGGEKSEEGGYIMMMLGCPVNPLEVKVFKR